MSAAVCGSVACRRGRFCGHLVRRRSSWMARQRERLPAVPCQAWQEVSQWPLTAHGRWPQRPDLQWPEPGLPRRTRAEIRGSPLLYGAVGPETSFSGSSLDGSDNTYSQHSLSFRQNRVGWRYVMMAVLAPSSGLLSQWISLDPKHPCLTAHTMRRVSELERGPSCCQHLAAEV